MKKKRYLIMPVLMLAMFATRVFPQAGYSDYKAFTSRIEQLSSKYPALCSTQKICTTAGGKTVYVISIGPSGRDNRPAIAVLGGIEGPYLSGRELALGFAEKLLEESGKNEIISLLSKVTFYVFPDASPDASEQYFAGLRHERSINARPTDDDRDFRIDEDPCEDLDGNGLITLVRILDPAGTFTESDEDKRIMVKADLSKGETGSYIVFSEGFDNDKDGQFNEDGQGGVAFNRNFTFNYEEYGFNSGLHAVSEPESKAVADFLYDHFNIYVTMAFGPQDNLGQPMKAAERPSSPSQGQGQGGGRGQGMFPEMGERRITAITRSDESVNKLLSEKYHQVTGVKGNPPVKSTPGNFMEWAYFHYGRYSFSTPAWWIQQEKIKNAEAAFLKYAEKKGLDVFVPWKEISHPDFPGKKAEAGGIKPFAMTVPPADTLDDLVKVNYRFITEAAKMHPELEFLDVRAEPEGENIYRLTLKVHNKGIFATCAEAGNSNMWTRIMRMELGLAPGQSILSGQKIQRIRRLEGGDFAEFSWLIAGKGSVKASAGALNTGTVTQTIELK